MATQNSKGLMGLSHFENSRKSTELWEPIYQASNTWVVQLTPPPALGLNENSEEINLLLEGVKDVSGLDTNKMTGASASQAYKGATRRFAGAMADSTTIDVTINFEFNLRYNQREPESFDWKLLRSWTDLVWDPLAGRGLLKQDYVAPRMVVTMLDRAGTPYHQWILRHIFPTTGLSAFTLNAGAGSIYTSSLTFACDTWSETSR